MKKNFTAALLAMALLCALTTGCGSRKNQADNNSNTTVTTPNDNNGNGSHSMMDDVEQGVNNAGDALMEGTDRVEDALTGDNHNNTSNGTTNNAANNKPAQSGVPYDELLNDGRVHDTDGNLNDGENSSSAKSRSR